MKLKKELKKGNYGSAKIKLLNSMHISLKAKINGISVLLLLDTGASSSCIDLNAIKQLKIKSKKSKMKAVGAGNSEIDTKFSKKNNIKIGDVKFKNIPLILLDLSHVNGALKQMKSPKVHGVLGADILQSGKAIIDYSKFRLFLKEK
jgi:predicted aspartyl protease